MGILHDGKDPLAVVSATSKPIEEIRQTIFMERTSHQHPHHNSQ